MDFDSNWKESKVTCCGKFVGWTLEPKPKWQKDGDVCCYTISHAILCICWSNFKFWTTTVSVKLEKNEDIWAMHCCPDVCFVNCGRTILSISNFQITSPFHHFYRIYIDRDWNVFLCIFLALRHTHMHSHYYIMASATLYIALHHHYIT